MTAAMGGINGQGRVPAAIAASLLLHAGALAAWLRLSQRAEQASLSVITDVDILAAPQQPDRARPGPPPSLKDFLKLALPSIPKTHGPMAAQAPELKRQLMEIPQMKLEDKGRLREPAKLEAIDLGRRKNMDLARVDQPLAEHHSRAAMDLPKLEEIGSRRAPPKILAMAALEEKQSQLAPRGLGATVPALEHRRAPATAPLLPAEASSRPSTLQKMADMLTSDAQPLKLEPRTVPARALKSLDESQPAPSSRASDAGLKQVKKKAVEIEGPLSNRKVVAYSVPSFPQWAKDQGIVEADVAIRFYVDASGAVLEEMRVERTSGFGRLDRLAMDHLKRWRFAPLLDGSGNQWGIITFRFVLE